MAYREDSQRQRVELFKSNRDAWQMFVATAAKMLEIAAEKK